MPAPRKLLVTQISFCEASALLLLALLCSTGCNDASPYPLVSISGQVTYDDGSPIPADSITVIFDPQVAPLDAQTHPKPATAEVNVADGTFDVVSTFHYGDGVIRGPHKIRVISYDAQQQVTDAVPAEYRSPETTPLKAEIDAGQHVELKIRKSP